MSLLLPNQSDCSTYYSTTESLLPTPSATGIDRGIIWQSNGKQSDMVQLYLFKPTCMVTQKPSRRAAADQVATTRTLALENKKATTALLLVGGPLCVGV